MLTLMEGFILMHKPSGLTSAAFLNKLKKKFLPFGVKKIGHGGTLDKFANGLLVVGLGRSHTKQLYDILKNTNKEYIATIQLGVSSSTDDPAGNFTITSNTPPAITKIKSALKSFPLDLPFSQDPPVFSARKLQGKRLSDYALKGDKIRIQPNLVTLNNYEIIDYQTGLLTLKLNVSSGFYVRSFARDLGQKLASGGYVKNLTRSKIGSYQIKNSLSLEDLDKNLNLSGHLFGKVQGIGFRHFLKSKIQELNLSGQSQNLKDNSLYFFAAGHLGQLAELQKEALIGPTSAQITNYFFLWSK